MPAMEDGRWRRVEEVFHLALRYDGAAREAYLDGLSGEDQSLVAEVRSLISSHERSGEFLNEPQLNIGLQLLAVRDASSREGKTIGSYSLKSRIGMGGMG